MLPLGHHAGPPGKLAAAARTLYSPASKSTRPVNAFDLGFLLGKGDHDSVEAWPENWQAIVLFMALRTQWVSGFAGPTGLNYVILWHMIERLGLSHDDEDELFSDVQYLEAEALGAMHQDD